MSPRECICGDYESEHTPAAIDPLRRCRVRVCLTPPSALLPEGGYERCDCPGFKPQP